jgi:hypothetical protein
MTCCSEYGKPIDYGDYLAGGFDPAPIYKTYDEFANEKERIFIEYFLRDAYEFYGYDFQYYNGEPMGEDEAAALIEGFDTINRYMEETWLKVFLDTEVSQDGQRVDAETEARIQKKLLGDYIKQYDKNRRKNVKILMEGLRFVSKVGQPLHMMPRLELDPALLENPIYH